MWPQNSNDKKAKFIFLKFKELIKVTKELAYILYFILSYLGI